MPDISKITMPLSGQTYNIKDEVAREAIAGGINFIIAWNGQSTPIPANIPAGVSITYQGTTYIGTLSAEIKGSGTHAQAGAFYLVYDNNDARNYYMEFVPVGADGSKSWEQLGSAKVDLSGVVTDVTTTGKTSNVLGTGSTFSNASSNVSFETPTTDEVLGTNTTFTVVQPTITVTQPAITITPTTEKITGTNGTVNIPNVTGNSNVTIPNVTNNSDVTATAISSYGTASTWTFTVSNETLVISGANGSIPTGSDVIASKVTLGTALNASKVTLGAEISAAKVGDEKTFVTGMTASASGASATASGASVSANIESDPVAAITAMPTATAAAQTITVTPSTVAAVTGLNVTKHQ